jgi:8-oxo-dGTP diphosphatase
MKSYSLGFIFSKDLENVLLIHKQHPDWQKGKLNGIGGKIESGETPKECIVREVKEECNLEISLVKWQTVGRLHSTDFETHVFYSIYQHSMFDAKTITDEEIEWINCQTLPKNCISNLTWLIPLCIDSINNDLFVNAEYEDH